MITQFNVHDPLKQKGLTKEDDGTEWSWRWYNNRDELVFYEHKNGLNYPLDDDYVPEKVRDNTLNYINS